MGEKREGGDEGRGRERRGKEGRGGMRLVEIKQDMHTNSLRLYSGTW